MIFSPFPLFQSAPPPAPSRAFVDSSVYILQLGRGGALDRSSVTQEDLRQPYQAWESQTPLRTVGPVFYVAPPLLLPTGFKTSHSTTTKPTWLVPIYLAQRASGITSVDSLQLELQFDNAKWQPLLVTAGDDHFDYILPQNRLKSAAAFVDMRVYNGATPDLTGDTLHIKWRGSLAPNAWTAYPYMIINAGLPQPICYVLMQRRNGTEAVTSTSMGWSVVSALVNPFSVSIDSQVFVAQESGKPSYPQQDLGNNRMAQPVDWALSTPLLGDGKSQLKARGVFAVIQSYGKATNQQVQSWPVGPYATITTSDFKDFSTQQVDWDNGDPHEIQDVGAPRFRIQPNGATEPTVKTGDNVATWSDTTLQNTGNMLIDDAAVDTIATSEGVRGERFRSMLFGCMNSNGEQLKVSKVRILTRQVGGLRRTGRRGLT